MKSIVLSRVRRVDAYKIEGAVPEVLKGGEKGAGRSSAEKKRAQGKLDIKFFTEAFKNLERRRMK